MCPFVLECAAGDELSGINLVVGCLTLPCYRVRFVPVPQRCQNDSSVRSFLRIPHSVHQRSAHSAPVLTFVVTKPHSTPPGLLNHSLQRLTHPRHNQASRQTFHQSICHSGTGLRHASKSVHHRMSVRHQHASLYNLRTSVHWTTHHVKCLCACTVGSKLQKEARPGWGNRMMVNACAPGRDLLQPTAQRSTK